MPWARSSCHKAALQAAAGTSPDLQSVPGLIVTGHDCCLCHGSIAMNKLRVAACMPSVLPQSQRQGLDLLLLVARHHSAGPVWSGCLQVTSRLRPHALHVTGHCRQLSCSDCSLHLQRLPLIPPQGWYQPCGWQMACASSHGGNAQTPPCMHKCTQLGTGEPWDKRTVLQGCTQGCSTVGSTLQGHRRVCLSALLQIQELALLL